MAKYRVKTEEEFKRDGLWIENSPTTPGYPQGWNVGGRMNYLFGKELEEKYTSKCKNNLSISIDTWTLQDSDYCLIEEQKYFDDLSLHIGRYIKALVDYPNGGEVKKGEIGKIISERRIDFPSQEDYFAPYALSSSDQHKYELMPESYSPGDLSVDLSKPEFIVGKWYKNLGSNGNYYAKFKSLTKDRDKFWHDGCIDAYKSFKGSTGSYLYVHTTTQLLEDLSEIQEYLPDGHPDKIVKKEDYTGRYIRAKIQNIQGTGVNIGEIIRIKEFTYSRYILDKTALGISGYNISKPLNLLEWELLPEDFNPLEKEIRVSMEQIQKEAKERYPIGCKYLCASDIHHGATSIPRSLMNDSLTYGIVRNGTDTLIYAHGGGGCLYKNGTWAELVSLSGVESSVDKPSVDKPSKPDYVKCIEPWDDFTVGKIYNFPKPIDDTGKIRNQITKFENWRQHFSPATQEEYTEQELTKKPLIINKEEYKKEPLIENVQSVSVMLRTKNKSIKF